MAAMSSMKRYTFEIEEERKPFRKLRIEAPGTGTLADLALRMQAGLDLPAGEGWSFYRSWMLGDSDTEFGSEYRARRDAAKTRLDRLALRTGARMRYQHGEGYEHVLTVRVVAVGAGDDSWKAPPLPPPAPGKPSAAARARVLLDRSARAGELDPDALRALRAEELAFARERLDARDGPEDFGALNEIVPMEAWLSRLPLLAAEAGLVKEALEFTLWLATCCGRADALVARVQLLARSRRMKQARALLDDMVTDLDDEPSVLRKAAAVCVELGELERAERLLRAAIAYRGRDGRVERENALAELGELLEKQGRAAERPAAARVAAEAEASFDPEGDDELFQGDGPVEWKLVRRDDPCPCGSGRKHRDCCYDVPPDDELEFELLCEVLDPLMDEVIAEDPALFSAEFARVVGPEFEGLAFPEISPLLPDFQAEWVYMHWFTLDRTQPPALARVVARHPEIPKRERQLLERALASHVSLYRVARPYDEPHADVDDMLQETTFRTETGAIVLFIASVQLVLARFIELDGHPTPMAHILVVPEGHEETMVALARERFEEFRRAHPALTGPALMKGFAPVLYRTYFDAVHAEPVE